MHAHTHTHTRTHTHTHTYTYTYTCTHTHTHMYTCARALSKTALSKCRLGDDFGTTLALFKTFTELDLGRSSDNGGGADGDGDRNSIRRKKRRDNKVLRAEYEYWLRRMAMTGRPEVKHMNPQRDDRHPVTLSLSRSLLSRSLLSLSHTLITYT